jgi:glycerol uptake facilitator-like aquaporin
MAERLAGGNAAVALLANTVATGAALVALILTFGPISGAHLNPAVTLSFAVRSEIAWRDAATYVVAQVVGAIAGVTTANLMFGLPPILFSSHRRAGVAQAAGGVAHLWFGTGDSNLRRFSRE